jgi:hypothetical protein
LKQYPGTFLWVDPLRYTGAKRLQDDDDDDSNGGARNQEMDSRFSFFDLAWETPLLRCCSSLVVLLCDRSITWMSLETFSHGPETLGQALLCGDAEDGIDRDPLWIKSDLQRRS